MDPEEREEIIETALRVQFGELCEWQRPKLAVSVGPNDIGVADSFEEYRNQFLAAARRDLYALTDADIAEIRDHDPLCLGETHWLRHLKSDECKLRRKIPPPIAYGFGHPSFRADFTYWCKMPSLSLHEALMLSVGAEPNSITETQIASIEERVSEDKRWVAHSFLLKRRELFTRFFRHIGSRSTPISLRKLNAWFEEIELEIHPEFRTKLKKRLKQPSEEKRIPTRDSITSQERTSLLKLIAAMSCEQYSFDPRSERNETTSRILEDLTSVGLSMDPKTIRKWLNEATTLVDDQYWADD